LQNRRSTPSRCRGCVRLAHASARYTSGNLLNDHFFSNLFTLERPMAQSRNNQRVVGLYILDYMMKQIAQWAIDTATKRGATYCDARIVNDRQRALATKNGKIGHAADSESLGIGIRVIVNNAWGFASTDDLSRESVERTAARAVEIARASSRVQQHPIRLAPEKPVTADWISAYKVDPFSTSIEQNLALLMACDKELRSVSGVTLAEAQMTLRRYEQWFHSSEGSDIHQT